MDTTNSSLDASGVESCPKRLFLSLNVKIDSLLDLQRFYKLWGYEKDFYTNE